MEYPAGPSTVDCGVGSRIHPAPEGRGYSPRYYNGPSSPSGRSPDIDGSTRLGSSVGCHTFQRGRPKVNCNRRDRYRG